MNSSDGDNNDDAAGELTDHVNVANPQEFEDTEPYPNTAPVGDILGHKDPGITRFIWQNIDGTTIGPGGDIETKLSAFRDMQADHITWIETKEDTHKPKVRSRIHNHCRKVFGVGHYRATMAHTSVEHGSDKKPGGLLSITSGPTMGRVLETGSDPWARWVYTKFSASGGRNITLIAIYQPCKNTVRDAGPTTTFTQLYSLMAKAGRPNPHRVRKHFTSDLVTFVKKCQANDELVCVGGDFNETLGDDNDGLTKLCSECELQDIHYQRHNVDTHNFRTYIRGSKCIDYVLMDPDLLHSVDAIGYNPFNFRVTGDHRGLFMDVNTSAFFGSPTVPMAPLNARHLNSRRINQIVPYFKELHAELQRHNWFDQIRQLKHQMEEGQQSHALAEKLDKRRIAACQSAAAKLQRYPAPPYSPEIAELRNIESILRLAMSQHANPDDDYSDAMDNLFLKLSSNSLVVPESLEEIKQLRKQNKKVLRAMEFDEMKTSSARNSHNDSLIAMYEAAGRPLSAQAVRMIQKGEASKKVWKQCAAARGLDKGGGLSYVLVPATEGEDPKECETWVKIDDPPQVRDRVTQRLQQHFSQAKDCNLTSPPLDVTMDFEGSCAKAAAILNGTYDTSNLDEATTWLIEHLKFVAGSEDAIDAELSASDFKGKVKAWDERTSTSPASDVHLGHAKAYYALHPLPPNSQEERDFESMRRSMLSGHLLLLNCAIQFGCSFHRLQTTVNALTEKDPGCSSPASDPPA